MNDPGYYNEALLASVRSLSAQGRTDEALATLTAPLHEALYKRQDFSLLDELPVGERVALAFDYIKTQVQQGGFIQLIQNGYISLLLTVIEGLQEMKTGDEMIGVLDDVLKVYVLNVAALTQETSVAEFARLYSEFKEFEDLDKRFESAAAPTIGLLMNYFINK